MREGDEVWEKSHGEGDPMKTEEDYTFKVRQQRKTVNRGKKNLQGGKW